MDRRTDDLDLDLDGIDLDAVGWPDAAKGCGAWAARLPDADPEAATIAGAVEPAVGARAVG